jgi:CBS-domain-containing membrane protein
MPNAATAQPRRIVGGYIIGLGVGALSWLVPQPTFTYQIIVYAVVVGITMFVMVATDTEHPPACGTALGVAISGWSLSATLTILISAIILAAAHVVLARFLRNLL